MEEETNTDNQNLREGNKLTEIEPKIVRNTKSRETYFWDDCYPIGTHLNFEPESNMIYANSPSECRCYRIDREAKNIFFEKVVPMTFPEEFGSFGSDMNSFTSCSKKVKMVFERVKTPAPCSKVFKYSYKDIELLDDSGGFAEYLGAIKEGLELGYGHKLIWFYEVFQNFVSTKFSVMYSFLKEKGQTDSHRRYYIASLAKGHKNCLKNYYSLNFEFSAKNQNFAKKITTDSEGIDDSVKKVLKFSAMKKIFLDDFPADPDPRYCTYTFIEEKALICAVFDLRDKKIVQRSLITVYELFKALGFKSIYHSTGFSISLCTYSFKQDRLFLNFRNEFEYLDENNEEHQELLEESRDDDAKPHVYMATNNSLALLRSFNVVIEGVRHLRKRVVRVLNNSQETGFQLPGRDVVCITNTVDFQNQLQFTLFDEFRRSEKEVILDVSGAINSYIVDIYSLGDDLYILVDLSNFYLVDFSQRVILDKINYKSNLDHKDNLEDGDTLVNLNQYCGTLDLYRLDAESAQIGHVTQFSVEKELELLNVYAIDKILELKQIFDTQIIVLMKVTILPLKNRREVHELLIELKLFQEPGRDADYRIQELAFQRSPRVYGQFVPKQEPVWMVGMVYSDAVMLSEYDSMLGGGQNF